MKKRLLANTSLFGVLTVIAVSTALGSSIGSAGASQLARNLLVTPAVRQSLFDADAAYHSFPPSDYVGLAKGTTYYAFDAQNQRYYAAAGLVPNSKSQGAQVSTQDDGGYNLFVKLRGSSKWRVYNDGLGGAQDSSCPITIPAAVRKVWNWTAHPCYPNT
ncbi:MAG: hypothetical protein WA614_11160 [Acidimicrobiales bacterium]|jgi:hypothetical protein